MDGPCALSATSLQIMCQTSFYANSADDRAAAASLWKMMGVNTCNDGSICETSSNRALHGLEFNAPVDRIEWAIGLSSDDRLTRPNAGGKGAPAKGWSYFQ